MKAGTYYVGDLCYVMHDKWEEVCGIIIVESGILDGEFKLSDGTHFAIYSTAYGDGSYSDGEGKQYGVDSGSIGCICVDDVSEAERANLKDGHVHTFDQPFQTWSDQGAIHIGHVTVDTADEVYQSDDDYNEEN
jgi:hypothetical protein